MSADMRLAAHLVGFVIAAAGWGVTVAIGYRLVGSLFGANP
jgi:glycerol uptake facilitator-like aquaporin